MSRGAGGAAIGVGTLLEIAIPIDDLGLTCGQPVAFFVAVYDERGAKTERHPSHGPIEIAVPDEEFDARPLAGVRFQIPAWRQLGQTPFKCFRKPCTGHVLKPFPVSLIMYVMLT